MKVILIKNCKDGKVNDVIEVAPGYGQNFLIRNGYALPFNKTTSHVLDLKKQAIADEDQKHREEALELQKKIQALILEFKLKETNMVVHGSITTKKVVKALEDKGIKLEKHSIEDVHITSLGLTVVTVKLYKEIHANLRVKVLKDE